MKIFQEDINKATETAADMMKETTAAGQMVMLKAAFIEHRVQVLRETAVLAAKHFVHDPGNLQFALVAHAIQLLADECEHD